jgi:lysozyme
MTISNEGVEFICQFEGFRASPYRDSVGVPTIGYGTTVYEDGSAVRMTDGPISRDRAMACLKYHIEERIAHALEQYQLTQPQYDALCSFCYNLGAGALDKSSLKHAILNGAGADEITTDFDKWDMAGGHVLPGLLTRRQHEAKLFTTGQYS